MYEKSICDTVKGQFLPKKRACEIDNRNLKLIKTVKINKYCKDMQCRNEIFASVTTTRTPILITADTFNRWKQNYGKFHRSTTIYEQK